VNKYVLDRPPALTLWRPWPTLIFNAGKDVENRSWPTRHRGDLLIAAAGRWEPGALTFAKALGEMAARTGGDKPETAALDLPGDRRAYPAGIIGVVELYDVCTYALQHPGQTCGCSWWASFNMAHWKIRNPRLFDQPIPHRGLQRLWQVADHTWPAVKAQLEKTND
jgi:hypothetical protein